MATEYKRVRVDLCDDAAATGTDVGEYTVGFRIFTQRLEIKIVNGWTLRLVERWSWARDMVYI